MHCRVFVSTVLSAFFVAGCASSVSPLYTKTDKVTDPAIVGTWDTAKDNNPASVTIENMKNGSYQVTVHDAKSGDDAIYEAHLVQFGKAKLADLLLTGCKHEGKEVDLPGGAVALHQIIAYHVTADVLSYSAIDESNLKKAATQPGFPLQFRETTENGGDAVIISSTAELRHYFSSNPTTLFSEPQTLKRRR